MLGVQGLGRTATISNTLQQAALGSCRARAAPAPVVIVVIEHVDKPRSMTKAACCLVVTPIEAADSDGGKWRRSRAEIRRWNEHVTRSFVAGEIRRLLAREAAGGVAGSACLARGICRSGTIAGVKKLFNNFKAFAFDGNLIDLVVGFIIGAAITEHQPGETIAMTVDGGIR